MTKKVRIFKRSELRFDELKLLHLAACAPATSAAAAATPCAAVLIP